MSRRVAVSVLAVGAALAVLSTFPRTGHLERATGPTLTTLPTKSTRTSHVMTGNDDETEVRKLAERYVKAINSNDEATIAQLNCAKATPGLLQVTAGGRTVSIGELERAPVRERFYVALTIGGEPAPSMIIRRQDGVWCVRD